MRARAAQRSRATGRIEGPGRDGKPTDEKPEGEAKEGSPRKGKQGGGKPGEPGEGNEGPKPENASPRMRKTLRKGCSLLIRRRASRRKSRWSGSRTRRRIRRLARRRRSSWTRRAYRHHRGHGVRLGPTSQAATLAAAWVGRARRRKGPAARPPRERRASPALRETRSPERASPAWLGLPSPEDGVLPPGMGPLGVASGKGRKDQMTSNNPGQGMPGPRQPGSTGGDGPELEKTEPGDPARHRASMIQLEEFRKKVDRDILRDLKMSQEDFEKFLKDYASLARRRNLLASPRWSPSCDRAAGPCRPWAVAPSSRSVTGTTSAAMVAPSRPPATAMRTRNSSRRCPAATDRAGRAHPRTRHPSP